MKYLRYKLEMKRIQLLQELEKINGEINDCDEKMKQIETISEWVEKIKLTLE